MSRDRRITPREQDYSAWYNDVLLAADLIDESPTRGTVVLKPRGYAIWERIQSVVDAKIKEAGHQNAYFPLLIPKSFLQKEAEHVSGFALESAVVTHHRLADIDGELRPDPESKLSEEYIIRPTSETIINYSFSRWIQSYRDLPLLINQWANVMRWEMRTRPFLRTSEFLWQEGHTAHATNEQAIEEQKWALDMYGQFLRNYLAIDFYAGAKSESEKFAGANTTFTLEAMMQDGKALQCCTSHNLGQNFAKAFNISYVDEDNQDKLVWQTSWGISTRIIGAIIMTHSDDKGLVLPPMIAPTQVRIIVLEKEGLDTVYSEAQKIAERLKSSGVRVEIDDDIHLSFGERIYRAEKEGVPIRIEVGPRDLESNSVIYVSRVSDEKNKSSIDNVVDSISKELQVIQSSLLERSKDRLVDNTTKATTLEELKEAIDQNMFVLAPWDGEELSEKEIKNETGATIRCIPFVDQGELPEKAILSGKDAKHWVLFAKAY